MSNQITSELIKKCERDILAKANELQKDDGKSFCECLTKAQNLFLEYAENYYADYSKAIEDGASFSTKDKIYYDAITIVVYRMRMNRTIFSNTLQEAESERNRFYSEYYTTQEHLESALLCSKESDVFISYLKNRKNIIRENINKLSSIINKFE